MRVLLNSISRTQKDTGNRWVDLYVSDSTGKSTFKVWQEQLTDEMETLIPTLVDNVVDCVGMIELYRGTLSLRISSLKLAEEGSYDVADFYPSIVTEGKELLLNRYKVLLERLKELGSVYRYLVLHSFTICRIDRMAQCSGGVKEFAFRGGLLLHTIETAEMAAENARRYNSNVALLPYGETVDEGLVIAAALLHDIGKLDTLETTGIVTKNSLRGLWVGSVMQSVLTVTSINSNLPEEKRVSDLSELIHCIQACEEKEDDVPIRNMEGLICRNSNHLSEMLHIFNKAWYENDRNGKEGNSTMYCKELGATIIRNRKEEVG